MTVTVYSGPGSSAWQSTRFSATVNGNAAFVWGVTDTLVLETASLAVNTPLEVSWLTIGTDETVTVVVTRIAGAITSAKVYPSDVATNPTIVGGTLRLTVPMNTRLRVELNGDRQHCMHVFTSPLIASDDQEGITWDEVGPKVVSNINTTSNVITFTGAHGWTTGQRVKLHTDGTLPTVSGTALAWDTDYWFTSTGTTTGTLQYTEGGTTVDFTGSGSGTLTISMSEWTDSATRLVFGAGVHEIGRNFFVEDNCEIRISGDAVVRGSFDVRGSQGIAFDGHGLLSGDYKRSTGDRMTQEWFNANVTGFSNRMTYAMFFGRDNVTWRYTNQVSGITVTNPPYFLVTEGIYRWTNVHYFSPWFYSTDGFDTTPKQDSDLSGYVTDCFVWAGDDCIKAEVGQSSGTFTCTGSFAISTSNSCFLLSYWPYATDGTVSTFTNCHAMHLGKVDIDSDQIGGVIERGQNTVVKAWMDGSERQGDWSRSNITFTNLKVWGPHASRLFVLENVAYPFEVADQRDAKGQLNNFLFDGLWVEQTPGQISRIVGNDFRSAPCDVHFRDFEIGGVRVAAWNWSTFVYMNAYPYRIFCDGHPVA